ncbi:DUF1223 domain-containing protein [Ramlibacter sp. G-1-2-2]|uniref:DUF1223 domain-containing protein n=1 Tax=Ramlibacter agri TaxID=2728837 RepID=A0A848HDQ6_9BURK|nr:DUF1223 domain-containing protein [Ramlibacter agri]NML48302.1 DUF1223 domain-containing protein [Ramlibacter agri]
MNHTTLAFLLAAGAAQAQQPACHASSPATRTPVIELYTSEGCSSCPPADHWISGLKDAAAQGRVVVQAFHVGYWDSQGWVDRFATPAYTGRQREVAANNHEFTLYTPQLVRDGRDWRDYGAALPAKPEPATVAIQLTREGADVVQAQVIPQSPNASWAAYWTVTEHGHASKVTAGENAGEALKHDFVVRQYVTAGNYQGAQALRFRPVAATPGHAQQVNLVVTELKGGKPLQALSLSCS